ncbi:MAG: DUF72 domain-containing protein [Candidatus Zixiibacteriota bacterium]
MRTPRLNIGTSSFSESDWVGPFYPKGLKPSEFLSIYARKYNIVEIDATYYRIPSKKIVDGWNAKTPDDFTITAKFPRSIVHAGEGPIPNPGVILNPEMTYSERDSFLDVMSRLGRKLGPLVLQFPYFSSKVHLSPEMFSECLDLFLNDLPDEFRYAVEIRNRNWLNESFLGMLKRHKAALTLIDHPWMLHGDEIEAKFDPVTSNFVYIRLLGDRRKIESLVDKFDHEVNDQSERLERWARLISRMLKRDLEVMAFANNHFAGYSPGTADKLIEMTRKLN